MSPFKLVLRNALVAMIDVAALWGCYVALTGNPIPTQESVWWAEDGEVISTITIYRGWDVPSAAIFAALFTLIFLFYKSKKGDVHEENRIFEGILGGMVMGVMIGITDSMIVFEGAIFVSIFVAIFVGIVVSIFVAVFIDIVGSIACGVTFGAVMTIAFGGPVGLAVALPVPIILSALRGLWKDGGYVISLLSAEAEEDETASKVEEAEEVEEPA